MMTTVKTHMGTEYEALADPKDGISNAELLKTVVSFYHQTLLNDGKGIEYLQSRKCITSEAVEHFKIGYANRSLGYKIPPKTIAAGKALRNQLTETGIYRESGHEHFSGSVVFPVFDGKGEVTQIYGRKIRNNLRQGTEYHLQLPCPSAGVWNQIGIQGKQEWILCESIIDALSFWSHGFQHVTASFGIKGFTTDHWRLLRASGVRKLWIAYDNDEEGNRAANDLATQIETEGVEAWRIEFPPEADANDVVRNESEPQAVFASLLASAKRMLPENSKFPKPAPKSKPENPVSTVDLKSAALEVNEPLGQAEMMLAGKQYRVRGLNKNKTFDQLKVNLCVTNSEGVSHIDTFDLYHARNRSNFIATASKIIADTEESIASDLSHLIRELEQHQEQKVLASMQVQHQEEIVMSPEEEAQALALLREPKIFERILGDYEAAGTVGEDSNKILGYLIAVSRKLDDPLSGLILSRSAAGKSSLMNAILDFVPDEDKEILTSMTSQALFYMPQDGLKHKVMAFTEDEGSDNASYPLKILQSEKELILAVTVKDPDGGMPKTDIKKVSGPVAQFMTSTQAEIDEEVLNRFIVLTVDEDREQTRRIHEAQRKAETVEGILRRAEKEKVLTTHHNAQRLLKPLKVVNPYAPELKFPDDRLRLRRDHKKYLGLIRVIAFLRQYQKPVRSCDHLGQALQYIEVDPVDLELADRLAEQALTKTTDDLAPQTRKFLVELCSLVADKAKADGIEPDAIRLTRRQIREHLKWGATQVRCHLSRLLEMEYVISHRIAGSGSSYCYELAYSEPASTTQDVGKSL